MPPVRRRALGAARRSAPTSSPSSRQSAAPRRVRCACTSAATSTRVTSRSASGIPVTHRRADARRPHGLRRPSSSSRTSSTRPSSTSASTSTRDARGDGAGDRAAPPRTCSSEALDLHAAGSAGTKSEREDAFLALVRRPGAAEQHDRARARRWTVLWPDIKLNAEVDGPEHRRKRTKRDDQRRDTKLRAAGYTVVRFTAREVEERPQWVRASVAAARRPRGG